MRRNIITVLMLLLPLAIASCNTINGAGDDISKGGNAISNSAEKHGATN